MNMRWIGSVLVPTLVFAASWTGVEGATGDLDPVRVVDGRLEKPKPIKLDDIKVKANGDGVELTRGSEKVKAHDCGSYLRAVSGGFAPYSTYDIANESFFKRVCLEAQYLQAAKKPTASFVRDYRFRKDSLAELPPCALSGDSYYGSQVKLGLSEGSSLASFHRHTHARNKGDYSFEFEDDTTTYGMDILAFGDFNGDGLDDMLVFATSHAKQGSYSTRDMYVLSRKQGERVFRVAVGDSWCPSNLDATFKGCSGDDFEAIRRRHNEAYRKGKFQESVALLEAFRARCFDSLVWPHKLWLISDLMVSLHRAGNDQKCLQTLADSKLESDKNFSLGVEENAKKAILHNRGLCAGKG